MNIIIISAKKIIFGILAHVCENRKTLKSIADTSVIACEKVISVMDIVSTKRTNTIATNVSVNCHKKKNMKLIAIFCIQFY